MKKDTGKPKFVEVSHFCYLVTCTTCTYKFEYKLKIPWLIHFMKDFLFVKYIYAKDRLSTEVRESLNCKIGAISHLF